MRRYKGLFESIFYVGVLVVFLFAAQLFNEAIPDKMYVEIGTDVVYNFNVPVTVVPKEDASLVFENNTVMPQKEKSYVVTCRLFGIFPVKDIEVAFVEGESAYAGGVPIGIYTKTSGVLVIGAGAVTLPSGEETKPAENLVKSGDYIVSINGIAVDEKETLSELIHEYGEKNEILGIMRNDEYIEVLATPVLSDHQTYMLGIWVRDDLAGIGTLTFYQKDGTFGALGHPVSDGDTGEKIIVKEGNIYETNIIGIRKGKSGNPGELSGVIDYREEYRLGSIAANTNLGIYGTLDGQDTLPLIGTWYDIAYKQDIRTGEAYIISGITGELKKYKIEIQTLDYSDREENKGILFQVKDEELLELTGGIVQGMSGSPIIQGDKLIGAVTHVFVSDASMGYGIFIEKMLEQEQF